MRWLGRELFYQFCPHLDKASAIEGRQRQVGLPGRELFRHLCPHLDLPEGKTDLPEEKADQNPGETKQRMGVEWLSYRFR